MLELLLIKKKLHGFRICLARGFFEFLRAGLFCCEKIILFKLRSFNFSLEKNNNPKS